MNKNIKVLHAFNKYMPNSQNWAYNLIKALPSEEIFIYAKTYEKSNFYNPNWKYFDLDEGFIDKAISVFKKKYSNPFFNLFAGLIEKKARNTINKRFRQILVSNKIEILHSHFGHFSCEISKKIVGLNIKHIVSFYGHDYERVPFKNPKFIAYYQELFLKADIFVCEGNHGAKILRSMGCPPEKISVIHLGIDISKFKLSTSIKEKNSLSLIQIASITEKKGHIYTVRAFIAALDKCPNMHLTLVGDVKHKNERYLLEEIETEIKNSSYADKISIVKSIDYKLLYDFLEGFDVFIHPSTYARDKDCEGGAPVVLLDAQISGLPVISTYHCDIPEEVIHEQTGLLSSERDVKSLSKNIIRFYDMDDDEFQGYRVNAFNHVRNKYNVNKSGIELSDIYSGLI